MVLEYFSRSKKRKAAAEGGDKTTADPGNGPPILSTEDEKFLEKIAAESPAPSNPEQPTVILDNGKKIRGADAQVALMDGADKIPLPASPPEKNEGGSMKDKAKNYWSYVPSITRTEDWKSMDWSPYVPSLRRRQSSNKGKAADDLASAASTVKANQEQLASTTTEDEEQREEDDLTEVLDQLNLSARNNRVFSVTKESQKLMADFTLILKDIYNGVPTAYDDLESFLTNRNKEITGMFDNLPPWLQTLVKSLPAKLSASLAPEIMAATSEKPGFDAKASGLGANLNKKQAKKAKSRIPSLKSLLAQRTAVATMLRSILNFLKLRFPAFVTGTNVLMSLAVCLLLFVFWYCHKRGRETRLEKERVTAEETAAGLETEGRDRAIDDDSSDEAVTDLEETTVLDPQQSHYARGVAALNQPNPREVPLPAESDRL